MSKRTALLLSFVVVSALLFSACQINPTEESSTPTSQTESNSSVPAGTATSETTAAGKQISLKTSYQSPAQMEEVAFTLTVDGDGVITEAQAQPFAKNPTSVMRQTSFAKDFPAALKGKKLAEIEKVDRIGGSSLTTGAFNKALSSLKAQL